MNTSVRYVLVVLHGVLQESEIRTVHRNFDVRTFILGGGGLCFELDQKLRLCLVCDYYSGCT